MIIRETFLDPHSESELLGAVMPRLSTDEMDLELTRCCSHGRNGRPLFPVRQLGRETKRRDGPFSSSKVLLASNIYSPGQKKTYRASSTIRKS